MTCFHITPLRNLESISTQGLIPALGPRSIGFGEDRPAIYFFASREDLEDGLSGWLPDQFDEEECLAVLCISGEGLSPSSVGFELVSYETIAPGRIHILSEDILAAAGVPEHDPVPLLMWNGVQGSSALDLSQ